MKCLVRRQLKYCEDNNLDTGRLTLVVPMMTLHEQSSCASVKILEKVSLFILYIDNNLIDKVKLKI